MNDPTGKEPQLIDVRGAMAYLGLSEYTIRLETRRGNIHAKRIGKKYYYHRIALDNYAMQGAGNEYQGTETAGRILRLGRHD